jgi:RNA polymerase sigma-70 factor, ECF subfamily
VCCSTTPRPVPRKRREGYANRVELDEALAFLERQTTVDILSPNSAMERLASLDDRQARVVELRIFGGLTIEEAAEVVNLLRATVKRDWSVARLWPRREFA